MNENAIDRSPAFKRGKVMIDRYDTVGHYVRFWLSVGPYWAKFPRNERIKPWFLGLEDSIAECLRDC